MSELTVQIGVKSDLMRAVTEINAVRDAIDRTKREQAATAKLRRESATIAQQERQRSISKLPIETQINRLLEQRDRVSRFLGRQGLSDVRRAALELRLRQTQSKLGQLQESRSGGGFTATLKDLARQIPMVGRVLTFLDGPIGRLGVSFAATASAIGLFAVGTMRAVRASQALSDLSAQTQIGTTRLQSLAFAANATGTDFGALTNASMKLRKNQAEALEGNKEMVKSFEALGISMDELSTLSPDELFLRVSQSVQGGSVSAQQFNAILSVMGNAGREVMAGLQKDLGGLVAEFENSNLAISRSTTDTLTQFGDDWDKMVATAKAGLKKFGVETAGGLLNVGKIAVAGLANVAAPFSDTAAEMRDDLFSQAVLKMTGGDDAETIRKMQERLNARKSGRDAKRQEEDKEKADFSDEQSKKAERLLQLQQQLDDATFDTLSKEEQRVEILERIARIKATLNLLDEEGGDNVETRMQQEIKLAQLQQQLQKSDDREKVKQAKETRIDALARIGGFRGGGSDSQMQSLKRSEQHLSKIARETALTRQRLEALV